MPTESVSVIIEASKVVDSDKTSSLVEVRKSAWVVPVSSNISVAVLVISVDTDDDILCVKSLCEVRGLETLFFL